VGRVNRGTMLRYLVAFLALLERTAGPPRPTAALPQISPMEPVKTPFPGAQRCSVGPSSPPQRSAATQSRRRAQQHRTHHSGKDQSRFPLWESSLSEGSGIPALVTILKGYFYTNLVGTLFGQVASFYGHGRFFRWRLRSVERWPNTALEPRPLPP